MIPLIVAMIQKRLSVRGWPAGAPAAAEDTLAFAKLHGGNVASLILQESQN